jgi:hypothetical protein
VTFFGYLARTVLLELQDKITAETITTAAIGEEEEAAE